MNAAKPSVLLLYHFFFPDDVVSARQYTQLAEDLVAQGWDVTVLTSNRYWRDRRRKIDAVEEEWNGVHVVRVGRPAWDQANPVGRLANAAVMLSRWVSRIRRLPSPDAIVLGTDPQFAPLILPSLRRAHPDAVLAHWCFDLYPEAIMADHPRGMPGRLAALTRPAMQRAYRVVDLMVDLGPCMRRRLAFYNHGAKWATLTPWALAEPRTPAPPDPAARSELFGDAELSLLYSGNLGKAHDFEGFLELARAVYPRNPRIVFCFACGGNRVAELKAAVTEADRNVRIAGFCEEAELETRLRCADLHMVSLRPGWEGVVVPSKFFGALAMGKPVLYVGAETSDIAAWIREHDLGLCVTEGNIEEAAGSLLNLAEDKHRLAQWQTNALEASREHFARQTVTSRWDQLLRDAIEAKQG